MDLISLKNRGFILTIPLCLGMLSFYPSNVMAGPDDVNRLPVTVSNAPVKRTIQGTVCDASTKEELIGVNIRIKGTDQGTITDIDGKFTLDVEGSPELIFSYIGYKDLTVPVGDLGILNIKLQPDNEMLEEIVVVGEGTQKKVSVTGAIASVKGTSLKIPTSSLTNSLAGKLAGIISTTSTGEPGQASDFYIRGINTFGGKATPLILLDGVEISSGDLNRIPAESIESFSLLKDASATAIYGNRGANGVMLVTTKSGAENSKTTVNVSLENSYFHPMNKIEFADGATYMRTFNEAEQARTLTTIASPRYTEEEIMNTENHLNPYAYPDVDWYDLLFKDGNYNQRANVNVQGGGSRVKYYMSLQANHDTGLLDAPSDYYYNPNINNWEYNFQNNISYKLTNTTTIDMRMMAQIGNNKGPNYSTRDLYQSVMNTNPVVFPAYFPYREGEEEGPVRFGNVLIKSGQYGVNPYEYMMSSFNEQNYNTLNTSIAINQDFGFITPGLTAKVLVNFKNYSSSSYNRYIPSYFYGIQKDSFNPETGEFDLELLRTGEEFVHQSDASKYADQTFYLDARADWKRSFGLHNMTAMFLYMMREFRSGALPNRNQGYSGRLTYDYNNKYLVEFNFGINGSERLAKEDRFEIFPAASLGWVISSEDFWKPLEEYVNHFKIRGSYGLVGSDAFNGGAQHFLYQNNVVIGSGASFTTGSLNNLVTRRGHAFNTLAVQNAGWEHVKKLDIGADFGFFNQVNLTFDFFRDHRNRILMRRASFPKILGYWGSTPWSNIGEVINKGVEFSLNWNKQFGKDWTVDLRANFTYNQNEYKYVDEPNYPYTWQTSTGKPLNTLTGYIAEGLFSSQEEIDNWADQSQLGANIMPGDIKYRDVNGDGLLNSEDQVMLSSYNHVPRIQYGLGLNVKYKKIDFGVFFNGSAKRKIMINWGYAPFLSSGGDGQNSETLPRNLMQWIADEHWSISNPNPNATYPRLGTTDADIKNNNVSSSYWVRNGNFLRFKTLEIGYNFPHCRVYFTGDNLAVFSPFKLWDPELSWNAYPLQRTFNVGAQFTF